SSARDRSRNRGTGCRSGQSASSGWGSSAGRRGRACYNVGLCTKSRDSTANLHVIAARVAGLAAVAFGNAVGADLAIDRVAGIGAPVGALGIGLFLDHQLGAVPARLGRRFAGGAVLLDERNLALALVIQRVAGADIALAGRRGQAGARAPVALQEGEILLLLGLGRHDHRLGLVLGGGGLVLVVALVLGVLVLRIGSLGVALVDILVVGTFALILALILAGDVDVGSGWRIGPRTDRKSTR